MKEKLNLKKIRIGLPIFGLALLLLLSPCKVRNFIQTELGLPQTEVVNKNKSTISTSNCSNFEITTNNLIKEKSFSQHLPVFASDISCLVFGVSNFSNNHIVSHRTRNHSASTIPLYILYQNFKDYL